MTTYEQRPPVYTNLMIEQQPSMVNNMSTPCTGKDHLFIMTIKFLGF